MGGGGQWSRSSGVRTAATFWRFPWARRLLQLRPHLRIFSATIQPIARL